VLGFILGVVIAAASPIPQAQAAAACPREPMRIVEESNFTFPPGAHPTNANVRFALDVGSDGRLRRAVLIESSGDAAVDAAAAQAITQFRFAAPSSGCVAISTVSSWFWRLPDELITPATAAPSTNAPNIPAPGTAASSVATPSTATASAAPAACTAPFVRPAHLALPPRRESPGTATIDVTLDANARVTAVRLVQSSGEKKTDYAATVAARNGIFIFVHEPGCPVGPTVYRLELTFR
jgi:TonB family protein